MAIYHAHEAAVVPGRKRRESVPGIGVLLEEEECVPHVGNGKNPRRAVGEVYLRAAYVPAPGIAIDEAGDRRLDRRKIV